MHNHVEDPFSSEEMNRIYRDAAANAEHAGSRLTVLLAPYRGAQIPLQRGRDDGR